MTTPLAVLMQVRTEDRAKAGMAEVEHLAEEEQESQTGGMADLAIPWVRRIMLAALVIAVGQQLTGINSVMYYGTQMLKIAGFGGGAAPIANIALGVMAVLGGVICLFVLIDRVPRRTLIMTGFVGVTICHLLITPVLHHAGRHGPGVRDPDLRQPVRSHHADGPERSGLGLPL